MTDVDESVPLCTLSITPQTPGVTAGTGTVNTVPLAMLSITPQTPGFQRYPIFEVLDSNGNRIDSINFGNLEAGRESDPQVITLVNNSGSSVDVTLTATLGDDGTTTETVTSTLLSGDDTDYIITTDTFTVPANSTLSVYIKWRPPSTSRPGLKTWTMTDTPDRSSMEGWSDMGVITIDGSVDGELTDYQVEVVVDYVDGSMRGDFGDIRFTLSDEVTPIPYYLLDYDEEDTATFIVRVPTIPEAPDTTDILIYTGNSSATTTSNPDDTYLFFDDATGTYSDKWSNITGTGSYATVGGRTAINLASATTNILNNVSIEAPFKVELGLYSTEVITGLQYCQDNNPNTNERYHSRIDVRSATGDEGWESIIKDSVVISNRPDTANAASTWFDCVLTLDNDGVHTWTVNSGTPATATDTTYTSGYLALNHHNTGTGAVSDIVVSRYAVNPPVVGEVDWFTGYTINLSGGIIYAVPDLPELDLSNHYFVNVGGVDYE